MRSATRWVLICALAFCGRRLAAAPAASTLPFETLGIGFASGCTHSAKMLIGSESEWHRVWVVHHGSSASEPKVDFGRQVVAALLLGRQSGAKPHRAIEVVQVVLTSTSTLVYYAIDADGEINQAPPETFEPFHFIAIDKPKLPVRFVDVANPICLTCGQP